jgi:hypothetical protein
MDTAKYRRQLKLHWYSVWDEIEKVVWKCYESDIRQQEYHLRVYRERRYSQPYSHYIFNDLKDIGECVHAGKMVEANCLMAKMVREHMTKNASIRRDHLSTHTVLLNALDKIDELQNQARTLFDQPPSYAEATR